MLDGRTFARILFSDTHLAILLRSDTDFGVMYTCSARILLPDTQFAIMFCPNTGFGLTYTCSARILLSETFRYTVSF